MRPACSTPEGAVQVEIWSDVVCPWWYSFELDTAAPPIRDVPVVDHLAAKHGVTRAQALAMQERTVSVAAAEGLTIRFDRARAGLEADEARGVLASDAYAEAVRADDSCGP